MANGGDSGIDSELANFYELFLPYNEDARVRTGTVPAVRQGEYGHTATISLLVVDRQPHFYLFNPAVLHAAHAKPDRALFIGIPFRGDLAD